MPENPAAAAEPLRLHRYLAQCGVASRRKAEDLIVEGRVAVNGEIVVELGTKITPGVDQIQVDGQPVGRPETVAYLLYKPRGILTTMDDPFNRPTVVRFLPPSAPNVKPVGRLDQDTDGLLLLTNDGDLAFRLTHPRYGIEKEYRATVSGDVSEKTLAVLSKGVMVEGRKTAPAEVSIINSDPKGRETVLKIIIHEGRKRQVRLMCEVVGHPVIALRRVRLAFLKLKGLEPGQLRLLNKDELQRLRQSVNL